MILVGIPYHKEKRYAIDHVLDWTDWQPHKDVEILMRWHTGDYGAPDAIKQQFEFFRQTALQRGASHMYIMEADTIPPGNVLDRLLAWEKDVVGALYRYRSPDAPIVAWPKDRLEEHSDQLHESLVEVEGMGTGAVLLSRKALEAFTFFDWSVPDADYPMCNALRAKGFKIYLDRDCVCRHYADNVTAY